MSTPSNGPHLICHSRELVKLKPALFWTECQTSSLEDWRPVTARPMAPSWAHPHQPPTGLRSEQGTEPGPCRLPLPLASPPQRRPRPSPQRQETQALCFYGWGLGGRLFNKGIDLAVYKTPWEVLGTVPFAAVATCSPWSSAMPCPLWLWKSLTWNSFINRNLGLCL